MNQNKIKCVVWDLDYTIWEGILSEDLNVFVNPEVIKIVKELDARGILQSISSKNDHDTAMKKLKELDLDEYFIYPQINWNAKSEAISNIAKFINIGIDTLAFVDDQTFEREEVSFTHPTVLCIDAANLNKILDMDAFNPTFITDDSRKRRFMYQNDIKRCAIEDDFTGSKEEFLRTLNMTLTVSLAKEEDLKRAEELTVRTHQLNSTGDIYSYDELKGYINSENHEVLIAQLDDKYGEYGKIGLALVEKQKSMWELKLLLMSCRVMARGVGTVLLNHIIDRAKRNDMKLRAKFIPTNRNRIMYITYKFGGFKEVSNENNVIIFDADMAWEREIPAYINMVEN